MAAPTPTVLTTAVGAQAQAQAPILHVLPRRPQRFAAETGDPPPRVGGGVQPGSQPAAPRASSAPFGKTY